MPWRHFSIKKDPLIAGLKTELVDLADEARERAGIPFIITSGRRTEARNAEVGGVPGSAHVQGLAIDVRASSSEEVWRIVKGLLEAGAQRIVIGITLDGKQVNYHNIHFDVDHTKPSPVLSVKIYFPWDFAA